MKAFVAVCALIAVASAAPNSYGGGSSYRSQTIPMSPAGSPPVHDVPNHNYGKSVTYTAPGATYQAPPITYAAPMLTFSPPNINYNGQSVTYATSAQNGYGGNTQSYQPSSGGYSHQAPQVQNYQPASSGYSSGGY